MTATSPAVPLAQSRATARPLVERPVIKAHFIAAFVFAEIISLGGLFSDLEWGYVFAFAFFIVMMFIRPAGLLARRR